MTIEIEQTPEFQALESRVANMEEVSFTATHYSSWAEIFAVTGSPGDRAWNPLEDGTHTDPVTAETVPNAGLFEWTTGWEFIAASSPQTVTAQSEAAQGAVADAQALLPAPFEIDEWQLPQTLTTVDIAGNPTGAITLPAGEISLDNGVRLYFQRTLSQLVLEVGQVVRFAYQLKAGASGPPEIQFRDASNAVVQTVSYQLQDGWYIAEAEIPANTDRIRQDWTNATGANVRISRPIFAAAVATAGAGPDLDSARLKLLEAGKLELANLWPGASGADAVVAGDGGSTVNADGSVLIDANALVNVQTANWFKNVAIGEPVTALVRITGANVNQVRILFQGLETGTTNPDMEPLAGDFEGWWIWRGNVPAISGATAVRSAFIQVDNRPPAKGYTPEPVTALAFTVVEGDKVPSQLTAGQVIGGDGDELNAVSWTNDGTTVAVFARNATGDKVCRYTFTQVSDPAADLDAFTIQDWSLGDLVNGAFVLDAELTPASEISTAIQTQQAIDYTADPDLFIYGGGTHAQQVHTVEFWVDGVAYTIATLPTSGAVTSGKFIIVCNGSANDEGSSTEALTGSTTHVIQHGSWEKIDEVRYSKANSVGPVYLAMCPIVNSGFGQFTVNENTYDIATQSAQVASAAMRNPVMTWVGTRGRVVFRAVDHTGLCSALMTNRDGDVVPFRKGYLLAGTAAKVSVDDGDRHYLRAIYEHFS